MLAVFRGKPIIGLAGGIGSGKSFVAKIFEELGCLVINSDQLVQAGYNDPTVRELLRQWWGDDVFSSDNTINRAAIARRIFANPSERERLEQLLHPWVNTARQRLMENRAGDPQVLAIAWDTPLLFETGLNVQCDAVVFIEASPIERLYRVVPSRRWNEEEWRRRENLQWPLDKKQKISDYVVVNSADATAAKDVRSQVRNILSLILANR